MLPRPSYQVAEEENGNGERRRRWRWEVGVCCFVQRVCSLVTESRTGTRETPRTTQQFRRLLRDDLWLLMKSPVLKVTKL